LRALILADGTHSPRRAVVLTTGTFLRGVIHIGDERRPGGRMGDKPLGAPGGADRRLRPAARPAEDRHAAAPRRPHHRLGRAGDAAGRRRSHAVLVSSPPRPPPGRSPAASPTPTPARTRSSARTCRGRRCMAAISKASARATAPRSRTRSCASPTRSRIRSSLNPKGWTTHGLSQRHLDLASRGRAGGLCPHHRRARGRV
jgi:hypothetical protein